MKVYDCCTLIRQYYAQIGSGEQAYIPQSINCAINTFNAIACDQSIDESIRNQAAFAAANLLISDIKDC